MHSRIGLHQGTRLSPDGITVNPIDHFGIARRRYTAFYPFADLHLGLLVAKLKMKSKQRNNTKNKVHLTLPGLNSQKSRQDSVLKYTTDSLLLMQ